jgi:peptide/nickel transport system substrate-binding protein
MISQRAAAGELVYRALYDPLTRLDASGTPKPYLAKSVTPSADNKAWTVKLPTGITYGVSGKEMVAQDVVDDFTQYYVAKGSAITSTFAEVASVTAPNATTAVFHLKAPNAQFAAVLVSFVPFNPDLKQKYGDSFPDHPDGTGAFVLASWQKNSEIVLNANPRYWQKDSSGRKLPYLSKLIFKIIPNGATRNAALASGGVQGYESIQAPVLDQASRIKGVQLLTGTVGGYGWFMNVAKPPENDLRVRQALAYSTDQKAIVAAQGAGTIVAPINQYFTSQSPYYDKTAGEQFPTRDLVKAKALLAEYVNDPKRSDGKLVGSPVAFKLNYISGDAASGAAVQIAQQQWGALGIKVTLNALDEATWVSAALKGDTQVFWFQWSTSTPYLLYHHNYTSPSVNPTNWTRLDDSTVISAINALSNCTTASCTNAGAAIIANQFVKLLPVIFLMTSPIGFPINTKRVSGATLPTGATSGINPYPDLSRVWET